MEGRKARSREPGAPGFHTLLLAALLSLVPLSSPAAAVTRIDLHVLLGFNGTVRPGRFAPLVVTVSTQGPQLEVRVEAEVSRRAGMGGTAAWRTLSRTVTVPRSGSARVAFALPVPRDPHGLEIRVLRAGGQGQAGREADALLASRQVDLRGAAAPGALVVAVSSELAFDRLSPPPGPDGPGRIAYPHSSNLPESWAAYDCVDTVILRDTAGQRLRPGQVSALREWVYAGGTLLVTGGAPALLLASSGLRDLLPVEVTGMQESTGLAPLAAALGVSRGPRGAAGLAVSRPRGAAMASDVVSPDGVPLLVSRPFGDGITWYTAFDWAQPSIASWEGLAALWDRVAGRPREPLLAEDGPALPTDPWMRPLLASPHLSFPSTFVVLAFAAVYVLLVALLALQRPLGRVRPVRRALFLTAAALAAAAAGFLLFNRAVFDPRTILAGAARVEATAGDGLARVTEKLGLLTAGGAVAGVEADQGAVVSSASPRLVLAIEEAAASRRVSVTAAAGSRFEGGLVVLSDVIELPLDAALTDGDLVVSNGSPWEIRDAFFARAGRALALGTVPAGSRRAIRLDPQSALAFPPPDDGLEPLPDALSADFLAQAFPAEDSERPVLVGWLAHSPLGARRAGPGLPSPSRRAGSRALLVLRLR